LASNSAIRLSFADGANVMIKDSDDSGLIDINFSLISKENWPDAFCFGIIDKSTWHGIESGFMRETVIEDRFCKTINVKTRIYSSSMNTFYVNLVLSNERHSLRNIV
jgi:hypothetical protein